MGWVTELCCESRPFQFKSHVVSVLVMVLESIKLLRPIHFYTWGKYEDVSHGIIRNLKINSPGTTGSSLLPAPILI